MGSTRTIRALAAVATAVVAAGIAVPQPAAATVYDEVVSANPSNNTPNVNQGSVNSIAKVGNTMVAVGKFTTVSPPGSSATINRTNIFAFDANTGAISNSFVPNVNGVVNRVLATGDGTTVWIAGAFTQVNGVNKSRVARLNVNTGQLVAGFNPPAMTGIANDMVRANGRLYIGGAFKKVGPVNKTGVVALDPTTGADTGQLNETFTDVFNGGSVNVKALDVADDGSRLAVVGNFRRVNGEQRTQMAVFDTSGADATLAPWSTDLYDDPCHAGFDTYMRDVSIAPDNETVYVATTGAFGGGADAGTGCDTAARFELYPDTGGQQPSWLNYTGGDTLYAIEAIGQLVYLGGHQRWLNNPYAGDAPGAGAQAYEGMAVLDNRNGLPYSWNPGRARGVGLREYLVVDNGVWIAHDTNRLGKEQRKRVAFMPLAGGTPVPDDNTGTLPGEVYSLGTSGSGSTNVLYRVDTGGSGALATDSGPDWDADCCGSPSPFHNGNSNEAFWGESFGRDASLPASTPTSVFQSERWSPNDSPNMQWDFPAPNGVPLEVRLYFANGYSGTSQVGQRVFDVALEGSTVLDDYDIVADAGDHVGTMQDFDITSDGNVDIDFSHVVENPLVSAIEIVRTDLPPGGGGGGDDQVIRRDMTSSGPTGSGSVGNGGVDWSSSRGSFMVDGWLFSGWSDGTMTRRTYNGTSFGAPQTLNLKGASADNHRFSNELPNVTGMFFDRASGRLYYTKAGQNQLFYRYFLPESRIVGAVGFNGPGNTAGIDWSRAGGMFLEDGTLYVVDRTTGQLRSVGWDGSQPTGSASVISGPAVDGQDWRARSTVLYAD